MTPHGAVDQPRQVKKVRVVTYRHPFHWLGTWGGHLAQSLVGRCSTVLGYTLATSHGGLTDILDNKLGQTVRPSILVGLSNDPSWSIRNTKVQDLSAPDQIVQGEHNLLDGCRIIPPMEIQNINVIGLQLDQGCFEGMLQGFLVVSGIVDLDTGEFTFFSVYGRSGVFAICQSCPR
jgi:hypothetical protein